MRDRGLLWTAFQGAKRWGVRPSQLYGISGEYEAFCFDEAVGMWGTHVTNELEKIEGKNSKEVERKRQNKLLQLLDAPVEQRFRSLRGKTPGVKKK